jgi:hypothetical protein
MPLIQAIEALYSFLVCSSEQFAIVQQGLNPGHHWLNVKSDRVVDACLTTHIIKYYLFGIIPIIVDIGISTVHKKLKEFF